MPYSTERGVTSYSDRDTPAEFASGQDEEAARFNKARDRAFDTADSISSVLDNLYDAPIPDKRQEMEAIAEAMDALLLRVRQLGA